ncbi:MAG: glycoside hydrolase family 16 protein [Gloeobacteraceae cyanobacterium ES-bin-316]|nr:glycoside hydrolase family 16 protein [Ferruginibacter sp.]
MACSSKDDTDLINTQDLELIPPAAPRVPVAQELFDDFSYSTADDPLISNNKWVLRDGNGGPGLGLWSNKNFEFLQPETNTLNKVMRMKAVKLPGTIANVISQAEISTTSRKFFAGTYASRIKFYDAPVSGADGDAIISTFFTISTYDNNNTNYSEIDFEYLPNGGFGMNGPRMWNTTWRRSIPDSNIYNTRQGSFAGWKVLVCTVANNHVKYYVDGELFADHSGANYPREAMVIDFNLWFWFQGTQIQSSNAAYIQDVDWVYFAKDSSLTTPEVKNIVATLKSQSVKFKDNVQ